MLRGRGTHKADRVETAARHTPVFRPRHCARPRTRRRSLVRMAVGFVLIGLYISVPAPTRGIL